MTELRWRKVSPYCIEAKGPTGKRYTIARTLHSDVEQFTAWDADNSEVIGGPYKRASAARKACARHAGLLD